MRGRGGGTEGGALGGRRASPLGARPRDRERAAVDRGGVECGAGSRGSGGWRLRLGVWVGRGEINETLKIGYI